MSKGSLWKKAHHLFIGLLTSGYAVLALSIFLNYDEPVNVNSSVATNGKSSGGSSESLGPKLVVTNGITNDLGTSMGPWWITSPLANFQISNSTQRKFQANLNLSIRLGLCKSDREVYVTLQNQTRYLQLGVDHSAEIMDLNFEIIPKMVYNLTVEVIGPVCQIDTDPRLFLGEIEFNKIKFVGENEFSFK